MVWGKEWQRSGCEGALIWGTWLQYYLAFMPLLLLRMCKCALLPLTHGGELLVVKLQVWRGHGVGAVQGYQEQGHGRNIQDLHGASGAVEG